MELGTLIRAWYVCTCTARPTLQLVRPQTGGEFSYFKSTDGHFNNWSFNLRRPNVHLLPILAENPGYVLRADRPTVFSSSPQDNPSGLDQGRKANARCVIQDHSDLVCGREQGYLQEVSFEDPAGMGDKPLHPTCLSQSTRTSPDRKPYR